MIISEAALQLLFSVNEKFIWLTWRLC